MSDRPRPGDLLGGLLGNFGELLNRLQEVGEEVEARVQQGELGDDGDGKKPRMSYGVNMRVGLGPKGDSDDPLGAARPRATPPREEPPPSTTVQGVEEPLVDVFDEEDGLLVVAEMPGIGAEDLEVEVDGDILTLKAENEGRQYAGEVLLPRAPDGDPVVKVNHGIVELRFAAGEQA